VDVETDGNRTRRLGLVVGRMEEPYPLRFLPRADGPGTAADHRDGYYFYLVFFDGNRNPVELLAILANQLYPKAEMAAASYEVRCDRRNFTT
jgi:hypothetical protein